MSIDRKDVKHGIDEAAIQLKQAVDKVVEAGDMIATKAKEAGRRTGDQMIRQGQKLRKASR